MDAAWSAIEAMQPPHVENIARVLQLMEQADMTHRFGAHVRVVKVSKDLWQVQHFSAGTNTIAYFEKNRSTFTLRTSQQYPVGLLIDTMHVFSVIPQVSGTCYLNCSLHQLCAGVGAGTLVLRAIKSRFEGEHHIIRRMMFEEPLKNGNIRSWMDAVRLIYAMVSPAAPTKWLNVLNQSEDIAKDIAVVSGYRREERRTARWTRQGGSYRENEQRKDLYNYEGGSPAAALGFFAEKLGVMVGYVRQPRKGFPWLDFVPYRTDAAENIQSVDLAIFGEFHWPSRDHVILIVNEHYVLDSAAIWLDVEEEEDRHVIAGLFSNGNPGLLDSLHPVFQPFDWVTCTRAQLSTFVRKTLGINGKCTVGFDNLVYVNHKTIRPRHNYGSDH